MVADMKLHSTMLISFSINQLHPAEFIERVFLNDMEDEGGDEWKY
jgi:hypothetical protein